MTAFRFWCQKVLPLVYDESLSYYEILCKVVDYINKLIEQDKVFGTELDELRSDMETVQKWIADFNTSYAEQIIKEYLATMIFVEISDAGYIVYYIPNNWNSIQFNTTGLDVDIAEQPEYGHLVLSY